MTPPAQTIHTLLRDCGAIRIPSGEPATLAAGTPVYLTQSLGGAFTVQAPTLGGLFRIAGSDADALGLAPLAGDAAGRPAASGPVDEAAVWDRLRTVYDPEIPVNIVDLGLVYECNVVAEPDGRVLDIKMTLTAPGCGMGDVLVADVREKVEVIPTVKRADVELVFDPPWSQSMMSEAARLQTGMM